MSIPVSNVQYVDQLTVVKSDFLQPVNDVINYQLGLVGVSNAGLFAFGTGYRLNDYTIYNTGMYLNIVPVASAFVTPDLDPVHWVLLRSTAQLAAALAATTGASLVGTSSGATVESVLANLSFASIALLRAATAPVLPAGATKVTTVAAFYSGALTGGGQFRWQGNDSRADNGGTIILPTGYAGTGRWNRIYNGAVYANWFGTVEDNVALDDAPLALAMALFTNGRASLASGRLIITGTCRLMFPLIYGGTPAATFELVGASSTGRGPSGAMINYVGSGFRSGVIFYGANNSGIDSVNIQSNSSPDCINALHIMADNSINTTLTAPVASGVGVIATPASMSSIVVGAAFGIDVGGPLFEIVYVTATTGTTFTANFQKSHASGVKVGGGSPSSGTKLQNFIVAPADNIGVGILTGNLLTSTTQTDNGHYKDIRIQANTGIDALKFIGGGNVKNFYIDRVIIGGFTNGINITAGSGAYHINSCTTGVTESDVIVNGGAVTITSHASESSFSRFVTGNTGNNPNVLTIIGSSWQSVAAADDIVIDYNGALVLITNKFTNYRTATSIPIIRSADTLGAASPASITSIGNFYQNTTDTNTPFYQAGNQLRYGNYPEQIKKGFRLHSFNDFGGVLGALIPLTPMQGPLFNIGHGLSTTGASANVIPQTMGQGNGTYGKLTIPYTAFQNAALFTDLIAAFVYNASLLKITDIYAQVTTPFVGTSGTLLLRVGTSTGATNLLLDSSVATASTYGLVDTDLGVGLARATAVQGGIAAIASTPISVRLTSSADNLSLLTAGSVDIYVGIKKMN